MDATDISADGGKEASNNASGSVPSREGGGAFVPIDPDELAHYRCRKCQAGCINPKDSEEAQEGVCRDCSNGDTEFFESGGAQYRHRPEPDEPWRFACPECESFQLRGTDQEQEKYDCAECRKRTARGELVDRKAEAPDERERLRRERGEETGWLTETADAGSGEWTQGCPLVWCERNGEQMPRDEYREHMRSGHGRAVFESNHVQYIERSDQEPPAHVRDGEPITVPEGENKPERERAKERNSDTAERVAESETFPEQGEARDKAAEKADAERLAEIDAIIEALEAAKWSGIPVLTSAEVAMIFHRLQKARDELTATPQERRQGVVGKLTFDGESPEPSFEGGAERGG